jgi:ribonuclease HII
LNLVNNCRPTFAEEESLRSKGYTLVAGVDEVGRGALAGPVVAAAVIMPENMESKWCEKVRDSKQLSPSTREMLYDYIIDTGIAVGTGEASHEVIDRLGIVNATYIAMKSAIKMMEKVPQFVLIDYLWLPGIGIPQKGITNGDSLCFSIACASIIAKVTRDRMVMEMDSIYPGYGLVRHKGYGTKEHLECLQRMGPCPAHRRTFKPVFEVINRLI